MYHIDVSDDVYQSLLSLAAERGQTPEQLVADLVAQQRWEEHAAKAYDAYHARGQEPQEMLTEEEFFQPLQDISQASIEDTDADI